MKENHLKYHILGNIDANINNSKTIAIPSPIKLTIKGVILNCSFSFKAMVIFACKALENNQCP
jgi:hypothetical protein